MVPKYIYYECVIPSVATSSVSKEPITAGESVFDEDVDDAACVVSVSFVVFAVTKRTGDVVILATNVSLLVVVLFSKFVEFEYPLHQTLDCINY